MRARRPSGWGGEEKQQEGLLGGSRLLFTLRTATCPLPPAPARARGRSYLDAYFVFSNGSALTLDQLNV